MEALGVLLDRRGGTMSSIDHRLQKAEGTYGPIAGLLRNKYAPISERLAAWGRGPVSSAIYGGGGWYLNGAILHYLRRWENKHIRGFLKMNRKEDENMMMYYKRTNAMIYKLMLKHNVPPIYVRALRLKHSWTWKWNDFRLDDGSQPIREYMYTRMAQDWRRDRK
eukprot:353800-Karenia_brevis.AAC.1